jgi:hypothetical protein
MLSSLCQTYDLVCIFLPNQYAIMYDQWPWNLIYILYHSLTVAPRCSRLESHFKCFCVSGGVVNSKNKKCLILSCDLNETRLLFIKLFLVKYELTVDRLGFPLQHLDLLTSSYIIFSESPLVDLFFCHMLSIVLSTLILDARFSFPL